MWRLKYEYAHRDCKYSPLVKKLGLTLYGYPLSHFKKGEEFFITNLHIMEGSPQAIKEYIQYLKTVSQKVEVLSENSAFALTKIRSNLEYYEALYNPRLFYPTGPLHRKGREYVEICSWEKGPLAEVVMVLENSPQTKFFKLKLFKQEKVKNIFLMEVLPKMTAKQRKVLSLAIQLQYYAYPRKTSLGQLAKVLKTSKSNCHEILRRAESKVLGSRPLS